MEATDLMTVSKQNIEHSQNFLHNNSLVNLLINKSSICGNDIVYEIGPGKGIITKNLAASCKKVIAIEYDNCMANNLKKRFENVSNVEILCANFLNYNIDGSIKHKFFSNIPFNITASIMAKVLNLEAIQDIYFIMQYEAFLKHSGTPYYQDCLKSLIYKPFFEAKILHEFVPTDFTPVPKARIIFAQFLPKAMTDISIRDTASYRDFLAFMFLEKGQMIKEKTKNVFSHEQLKRLAKSVEFSPSSTINELTYQQWIDIFEVYQKYVSSEKKLLLKGAYNRLINEQGKLDKMHRNRNRKGGLLRSGKR